MDYSADYNNLPNSFFDNDADAPNYGASEEDEEK